MVATVRDYGVTWDEPDHRDYGRAILHYYRTGGAAAPANQDLNLYGGSFDAFAAVAESLVPLHPWTTRHLCTLAAGLLGLAGAWRIGCRLAGAAGGFWSALLLATTPSWYGHAFNNPQDIPFAAGYIWSLALLMEVAEQLPAVPWPALVRLGVVMGLTWGVRIGGVLLAGYLILAAAVRLRGEVFHRAVAGRIALVLGLAYAVMLAGWPAAHVDPIGWPVSALAEFTRFTRLPFAVAFAGQVLNATDIPWTYVPGYLLLTLPELVVALLLIGLGWALRARVRWGDDQVLTARFGLVAVAAVFPAAFVIMRGSVLFNAIRHLLFIVPPLLCLAGAVLAHGLPWLKHRGRTPYVTVLALLVAWGGWHLTRMVRLHPYEFAYYNAFTGGLRGAYQRYDLDFWGACYPEALRIITAKIAPRTGRHEPPWQIAACGAPRALQEELPPGFTYAADPTHADFLVGILGYGCGAPPGRMLGFVTREGVPLGYAVDLRSWRAVNDTNGMRRFAR